MNRREVLRNLSATLGLSTIASGVVVLGDGTPTDQGFLLCRPNIRCIEPNGRTLTSVAFSPDGSQLITTAIGEPLKVWDAETGRLLRELGRLPTGAQRVIFSPEGRRIAVSGPQRYVTQGPSGGRRMKGGSVVISAVGGLIKVLEFRTGRELAEIRSEHPFDALAFEPDGSHLTTMDGENLLLSWKIEGAREFQAIKGTFPAGNRGRSVSPRCLAFGAGARRAVGATFEANGKCGAEFCPTLKFWDLDTSRYRESYGLSIRSCLLSPNGRTVVIARDSGPVGGPPANPPQFISLLDFDTGSIQREIGTEYEQVVRFSADGQRFVTARDDGVLHLWDVSTWRAIHRIRGPEPVPVPGQTYKSIAVRALVFRPRGLRVASGGVRGWNDVDAETGQIKRDPVTGAVLKVEPLQIWEVDLTE